MHKCIYICKRQYPSFGPSRGRGGTRWVQRNSGNPFRRNGGDDETRPRDLCRDSAAWIGFTTTYNSAGTAKLPVSRTRLHELWVVGWKIVSLASGTPHRKSIA